MNNKVLTVRATNLYLFTAFFGLCIFSSFLLQKVYVAQYLLFVCVVFIYFGKVEILKINIKAVAFLLLFTLWSSAIFFLHSEYSQVKQLIKLLVVVLFFLGAVTYMNNLRANYYLSRYFYLLYYLIGFILILNFLHVMRNVYLEHLWTLPVSKTLTSTSAYRIENPGIYFGASNKNIWATKILLIWIVFHQYQKRISATGTFAIAVHFMALFSIIYTFSRTAQVVFLAYVFVNFMILIKNRKQLVKVVLVFILLPIVAYGMYKIIPKVIHFKFGEGDGFYARTILWGSILKIKFIHLIFGNGIQYGAYFIPRHTPIDNDNFHNVFLNQLVDVGLVGLFFYIFFMLFYFSGNKGLFKISSLALSIPLFLVINSQYLGYDNDVFNYLILCYPLLYFDRE